ncbi:MAG: flagellar biosynthetic protein FliO [Polyangiaceae bacterium]
MSHLSPYAAYLIETFITLVCVCLLAAVVLWGARRTGFARSSGPVEVRGYLPLDARRAIYLVKVGAQVYVVGVGETGFTKLGEIAASDLPSVDEASRGSSFAQVLARVRERAMNRKGER